MDNNVLTNFRITVQKKTLSTIPIEKTMAIIASERFAIYGNLEDIDILETDATVSTLTKIAPFLIFESPPTFSPFQQFYLKVLYEFCQLKNSTVININTDLLYHIINKVAQSTYPYFIEKLKFHMDTKWTNLHFGYTPDPETTFLNALRCVFEIDPHKILNSANNTRIYDVKKIAIDICMTIYGLEWALSDQGSSDISSQDVIKTFIDRHFNSYSIYYY